MGFRRAAWRSASGGEAAKNSRFSANSGSRRPTRRPSASSLHALLDGESATGAFRFEVTPGLETGVDVSVTLFARRPVAASNMSPLSSMFFTGKNDHRMIDDFRTELHDSDGLLMHTGSGEWIWRPLSNPASPSGLDVHRQ